MTTRPEITLTHLDEAGAAYMVDVTAKRVPDRGAGHDGRVGRHQDHRLLAVALGEATKTVPHAGDGLKTYRFTVRWGAATTSDDAEGAVIATSEARPTPEAITAALPAFRGDILQVPPRVSAVKVDGARAYALARERGLIEGTAGRGTFVTKPLIDMQMRLSAYTEEMERRGIKIPNETR